jgi:hypothetical protein
MTEEQVIHTVRTYIEKQFPKECKNCGYRYGSLKEYLKTTVHIGAPHSYDAEGENWQPAKPLGTYSFADCKCGNTLVIGSSRMNVATMCRLLWWAKKEKAKRGITVNELLIDLREKIDNQVLSEDK